MKKIYTLLTMMAILCVGSSIASAESGHGHSHDQVLGAKGGRMLDGTNPKAELFVEKDNTVSVTFYDDQAKPVPAADQRVTVIAETGGVKTTVEFEKKGDALVSKSPLPKEHALNLVVQFKQTPEAKPVNFRFVYEDHICGECQRAEYACICGH
jgi:hypothetical protein